MSSRLNAEITDIPNSVRKQLVDGLPVYRDIGRRLASLDFSMAISNARGTSDHAATYLKYLLEARCGIPVASVGPSIASLYDGKLKLAGQLCVTISQSGASRDLIMLQQAASAAGATTLAIVNEVHSPIAAKAEFLAPIHAGPEIAVAATKSYVGSLVTIAAIVASMQQDTALIEAIVQLPAVLERTLAQDWSRAVDVLADAESIFTISRGVGLSVACEAA